MNLIKKGLCLALALIVFNTRSFADTQPAEQLLPDDILALLTIPDWHKMEGYQQQSAWGKLWADPAMKPFRDNFTKNFTTDVIDPLEKQLGIKLADYKDLLQGQITLAATQPAEGSEEAFGLLLLLDAGNKSDLLTTNLADLKKKWSDSGKSIKSEKIRDVDFSTVSINSKDIQGLMKKIFPGSEEAADADDKAAETKDSGPMNLRIGQSKSLLIIGENARVIEKVLARQNGGQVTPLAEQPNFQNSYRLLFRESLGYGWLNFKPIYKKILDAASKEPDPKEGSMSIKTDKLLPVLGLGGLESLSARVTGNAEGTGFEFLVGVPEAQREGIFKIFALQKKDAAPPAFVPADAVKFQRWRVDMKQGWQNLETMLGKIEPSLAGMLQLMLSAAGKDKDPNFDLKKNLIENLGDDVITYQKLPPTSKAESLQATPSLVLLGSPNPGELLDAVRMLVSLVPGPISTAPVKEREFLGKKIYSISPGSPLPAGAGADAPQGQSISFTASAGYVAISTDNTILEEYLRSNEGNAKSLRDLPGLSEAAQKIGGMDTGLFTFENQKENMRASLEALKNDPEGFRRLMFFGGMGAAAEGEENRMSRWFNLKLLPSYDAISKYFGIAVVSGATTPDGLYIKAYGPAPAAIR